MTNETETRNGKKGNTLLTRVVDELEIPFEHIGKVVAAMDFVPRRMALEVKYDDLYDFPMRYHGGPKARFNDIPLSHPISGEMTRASSIDYRYGEPTSVTCRYQLTSNVLTKGKKGRFILESQWGRNSLGGPSLTRTAVLSHTFNGVFSEGYYMNNLRDYVKKLEEEEVGGERK